MIVTHLLTFAQAKGNELGYELEICNKTKVKEDRCNYSSISKYKFQSNTIHVFAVGGKIQPYNAAFDLKILRMRIFIGLGYWVCTVVYA